MTPSKSYSGLQIGLHWLVAVFVGLAWFFSEGMGKLADQHAAGTYSGWPLHVIFGLTVLTLVVIRLAVRLVNGAPDAKVGTPEPLATARHWGHVAIYALLILVPLGGIAAWFLGLSIAGELHPLAGNALLIIAGLHAAFALYHHYVLKDGTLRRMMVPGAD